MDGLDLHEVGHMFSCCEPCVRNKRCKQIIFVISFVLITVDVITDWLNWVQWSGVGGYDQYYFASIFETTFLCVAAVGTGLWVIEVLVIVKKWINNNRQHIPRIPLKYGKNLHEYLPKPEINFSLSEQEVRKYAELEVKDNNEHLFEMELKNHSEPEKNKGEELAPEFKVNGNDVQNNINDDKPPSGSEVKNNDKPSSGSEGTNDDKLPSESEVKNDDKPPSGSEVKNDDKPPSGSEGTHDDKPLFKPDGQNNNKSSSEQEVENDEKPSFESHVRNGDKPSFGIEVRNNDESGKNEDEREWKSKGSRAINRLGIVIRILVGIFEDFPVVLAVYYPTVMPMCGIPAKQTIESGITLATIISSMLNSLWTMVCLFYELCGCTEGGFCCVATGKHKKDKNTNVEETFEHSCDQRPAKFCLKKPSKKAIKETFLKAGKIIVYIVIFMVFSTTFIVGFLTVSHVLGLISYRFTISGEVNPFILVTNVMTGNYGAGLDAKPDQAMFIYLHYQLPDWCYITLNNSTKSESFRHVINRLYIGQFQELSHLKNGTLVKAIPCSRAMPFLQNLDKHAFDWKYYYPVSEEEYADCKIIFTLRYHLTNNNWQPFINGFFHKYCNCITVEYGIHVNNEKICPYWFNTPSSSSLLSHQVQEDILNYTCNSACGEDSGTCKNIKFWNIDHNQEVNSSKVKGFFFSLAINDLKTPDTCRFNVMFKHLHKFCDKSWGGVEPVVVPEEVQKVYPQFITLPIIKSSEDVLLWLLKNRCSELWQGDVLDF